MLRDGNEGMSTIPGFNQIQFEGFCRFMDQGFTEELYKFPKIEDIDQEFEFQLFVETCQLVEPSIKERDAVYESLTYSSELYVSAGLIWKPSKEMQEQTIFIGKIPLMNSLGTSIVNGIYRIVINQILQSPGIYYHRSELDHNGISVYTATIISDWGGRSELEIDRKERIWARVSRKQKISILVLSSAMGSHLREILENVCYPEIFLSFLNDKKKIIGSKENVILEFYQQFACCIGGDPAFSESLCKELQNKFFQQKCELGRTGRRNMNRRLNLNIPQNNLFLLPRDILAAADHLIGMKFGMGTLDDTNHLKNKRIRSVADLLQDQFGLALVRLENVVRGTICRAIRQHKWIPTPQNLVTSTSLTTTYEYFFGLHPLSQVLDRTNPLTQIVHGRKSSFLGPGGLTGRTASFRIRDIHPSYYGRICPIDTSEGINVGLIGSLAIYARMGSGGSLESPFYDISERSKKIRMLSLSPSIDEYYMVATGNSLALNQGIQEEQVVPARYRQEFLTIAWEQVHLRSIFPSQYYSIGASLIPFIEHNDANRALMSSNMQRQAVPLSRSEKCIVGTGLERQAALDSGVLAISERGGKIIYTDIDKIILSDNGEALNIPLVMYQRSNKNTCMHQNPQVWWRDKCIKKGQILADGAATVGGELALGKNVLVTYMPWEGYNSEDAVLISERLVYEDIYTSFHIRKYEIQTHVTSRGPERITNEIPHLEAHLLRNLDKNGIVMLGSWVEAGDILVGKLTPQMVKESSYAPEDRLLRAILGIQASSSKETCLKLPIGGRGRVIDVRWIRKNRGSSYNPETICVYISQKREIKVGDKVAGRHGNKGIISKILSRQDMPYLQDGIPVDMVFNPLGVPSRMNVGQIFECSLGLAGDLLDRHYRIVPFDERYEQEASRKLVFSELYEASKQTGNPWVLEPEYPGKSRIFDGRTGDIFEQPVIIGKPYILKLIHQVDDKIHGRSSGHYALVTQQPLRGRAKQGGQRVGEMEVWALEGFGVAHILQEMLTYKSDHIRARQEVLGTTIIGGTISYPEDAPESFRLLVRELRSLALELNHFFVSEKNFQINRKEV
uniref:DNA-directed RNA polymerase subunit beta n=1 Tax=Dendrotrophe varians TaxID=50123 RepID=A0A343S8W8_9MAGN|nr:RNA polymerase beta subunit [Dendrotrophe varians]AUN45159.1 RNA polymerase beta subunit [Dendrotrophe varians]